MCGVGALRLQTGIEEEDILYLHQENMVRNRCHCLAIRISDLSLQIYSLPFCVCHDHSMKSVVLCIRGTLSFKVVMHGSYLSHQDYYLFHSGLPN